MRDRGWASAFAFGDPLRREVLQKRTLIHEIGLLFAALGPDTPAKVLQHGRVAVSLVLLVTTAKGRVRVKEGRDSLRI